MKELENEIVALTLIAFWLWIGLLWALRGLRMAGVVAAVLSWAGATLSVTWAVEMLRRIGHWPLM